MLIVSGTRLKTPFISPRLTDPCVTTDPTENVSAFGNAGTCTAGMPVETEQVNSGNMETVRQLLARLSGGSMRVALVVTFATLPQTFGSF